MNQFAGVTINVVRKGVFYTKISRVQARLMPWTGTPEGTKPILKQGFWGGVYLGVRDSVQKRKKEEEQQEEEEEQEQEQKQ